MCLYFVVALLGDFVVCCGMQKTPQPEGPNRAGYSVAEVSAMFGKDRSWGYRQIEKGRIKATTGFGAAIISAAEVARVCGK